MARGLSATGMEGVGKETAVRVANPKEHTDVMPPMGGAQLSPSDVSALAAYIEALNQRAER